jgi:type VI secretion system protein ImpB
MRHQSSASFIERNRAPRVHIAYELDTNNAQRKVELPFVMGVMADLSGKSTKELKRLEERDFEDFSIDNFDSQMRAIAPRVEFFVDRIGERQEGEDDKMGVELTFQKMEDFSPEAIAQKIPTLRELLKIREQLTNLMSWTDGRSRAEDLLLGLVKDPALLQALASTKAPAKDEAPAAE